MPDSITDINEVSPNVWGVLIIIIGAVLVCINEHDAGLMLFGGGMALLQHKIPPNTPPLAPA